MAENPVLKVARLLGGVVLMQGRLGHQVLGQMLVMGSNEVAVAGATVVVAATTRQRNAVAQVALRTALPALALRGLLRRDEERLERREMIVAEAERAIEKREQAALQKRERELRTRGGPPPPGGQTPVPPAETPPAESAAITALERETSELHGKLERLSARLRALEAARDPSKS